MGAETPEWEGDVTERTWLEEGRRISEAIGWEVAAYADVVFAISGDNP
jgi:hypothetical protein